MDREWQAKRAEEPIEPELEIVDAHHHLWTVTTVYGRYDLDELRLDTSAGHNIVATVFIDCGANYLTDGPAHLRPVGETRYVAERADRSDEGDGPPIAAIVGHADLLLGDAVSEVLDAHVAAAGGRFRGIRHSGARDDDPAVPSSRVAPPFELFTLPRFQQGARALAAAGLSFEAWQYHPQLAMVADLAAAVPELPIVVNHLGGPIGVGARADDRPGVLADTRAGLEALVDHENVVVKLGGIGMTRFGSVWHRDALPPTSDDMVDRWGDLIRWCIETFGPTRCMFESNFPVDAETVGYGNLWNAFKKMSSDYSDDERAALFADTARRVYRID